MTESRSPDPIRDERTWWLVIESDGKIKHSASVTISGRERLMNSKPEMFRELLGERFDKAVQQLREEFLKRA